MLPLRLCLILAILAGIGVIVISQVVLKPHVQGIIDARDDWNKKFIKAEEDKRKLTKDLGETRDKLKSTEADLEATRQGLTEAKTALEAEKKRVTELLATVEKLKGQVKSMGDE